MAQNDGGLIQLFPSYEEGINLEGLYLQYTLQNNSLVYTNFITSLDGRVAVAHPHASTFYIPDSIRNQRDWRLYQELATPADIVVISGRFVRDLSAEKIKQGLPLSNAPEYADLRRWRREHDMTSQPAVLIISASLTFPVREICEQLNRPVYVATGAQADANKVRDMQHQGAHVFFAGDDKKVEGRMLIDALSSLGFHRVYCIAGPQVLETLIEADVLNRLYLTQVHRLLGGEFYHTLLEGRLLEPARNFVLKALYFDRDNDRNLGQFFSVYDVLDLAT